MLQAVAFKNFIHFRDHQSLKFENGPNFIVGPNGSGKSAIFELIRRSLANKANVSASTVADFPAFVLSKFKIREKLSDKHKLLLAGSDVYSCLYMQSLEKKYKLVGIRKSRQETDSWFITNYAVLTDGNTEIFRQSDTQTATLLKILDKLIQNDGSLDDLGRLIKKSIEVPQPPDCNGRFSKVNSTTSECETILLGINATVVMTFPLRFSGPIQWNHSENMGRYGEHYNTTIQKAEILQALLKSDDVNEEKAKKIFDTIISPLEYTFERNGQSNIIVNDGERDIPLLKVPVGVIEAKQFSLIFAHRKYQTLLLEEPDRGMHPHIIQKLRDLVLRTEQEKVLVLTTHQTSMINVSSMARLFVCTRTKSQGKLEHQVKKMIDGKEDFNNVEEIFKEMVFSEAVLFVEGVTDKNVIRSIFDRILEEKSLAKFKEKQHDTLKRIVAKTLIIPCNGIPQYQILQEKAKNLNLQYAFLLDRDVSFDCKAKIMPEGVSALDAKWKRLVLHWIKFLLKQNEHGKSKMENFQSVENVLKKTEGGQTILKELDLKENDLKKPKIKTIHTIIEDVLLPVEFKPKDKMFASEKKTKTNIKKEEKIKAEGIEKEEEIKEGNGNEDETLFGDIFEDDNDKKQGIGDKEQSKEESIANKEKNRVSIDQCFFHWDSGDLEDMICKSILENVKPPPGAPFDEDKKRSSDSEKLFGLLLEAECPKDKNPIKETLMQMNFSESLSLQGDGMPKTFSEMLFRSDDMESFLNFLLSIETNFECQD